MKVFEDFQLRELNSFGVRARARRLLRLESREDIGRLPGEGFTPGADLVLGGGSNILFTGDIAGTVYLNRLKGKAIIESDDDTVLVEVGAGENWHAFVTWSLDSGYCGLENLSLIPGLAGAAPMQNIGAYGVEISGLLESVRVHDWASGENLDIPAQECGFSYRESRFKGADAGRFMILSCRLRLRRQGTPNISYAGISEELADMGVDAPDARTVSEAVIRLRRRKLPDPAVIGNAGSFFKNPEIRADIAEELQRHHRGIPVHQAGNGRRKVSAAWMIENCGWKGHREGDAGVSEQHALVLVNHGNASGPQLLELSNRIRDSVHERFGIRLEREPVVFPGHSEQGLEESR